MKKFITDNMFLIVILLVVGVGAIYYKNYKAKKEAGA
jgi:hypothetical protein